MPTITLQVGQCGNQLGNTFWSLLQQQQAQLCNGMLSTEWFNQCPNSTDTGPVLRPRVLSIDSEAKVAQCLNGSLSTHQLHILGHGGCGNNWACGYHFGVSSAHNKTPAWFSNCEQEESSRIGTVLDGIRKEAEAVAGVPDFLLIGSLAGGTGSGTGSALLEALADDYPASTLAAVAVAPSRTGDSTVQSINSCLAIQHLATYAHAVILIDNQTLLDKLTHGLVQGSSSSRSTHKHASTQGNPITADAAGQRTACLGGVNQLASEDLLGLLWPLSREDSMCGRNNIRQLAATICADPVAKFVEVCHLMQPASAWSNSMDADPWHARIKLLSAQLPRFDPYNPHQPITTSAAMLILRGVPGTSSTSHTAAISSKMQLSIDSTCWGEFSCCRPGGISPNAGWQEGMLSSVSSSWQGFKGGTHDVHIGSSAVTVGGQPSIAAALRRSSIGSLMRAAADMSLQLCRAGAYMHWYEQYGCSRQDIEAAAYCVSDQAMSYL